MSTSSRLPAAGAALAAAALVGLSQCASAAEGMYLKDFDIRQAPMTDVVTPAPANTAGGGELAVRTAVDRPDARYRDDESLTLTIDVTEDAYVWVFDTGTSGKVHQIYPNRFVSDNFLLAGNPIAIPGDGADYQLAVSHPKGAELLTVIASKDSTLMAQNLIDEQTRAGAFLALRGVQARLPRT